MDAANSVSTTKRVTIRASASQLTTLRSAFAKSQVVSAEELKVLHDTTGLPEKWIHNWYGRERKKTRKTATGAPDQADGDKAPSSDAPMSPLEIRDVKIEHRDALLPRSSSFRVIADISTTGESSSSAHELDKVPPKKKARTRGKAKKAAALDAKADCGFPESKLRYTQAGDQLALSSPENSRVQSSALPSNTSSQQGPSPFLHMIPPPTRSPLIQTPFLNALPKSSALTQTEPITLLQVWPPHQALQSNAAIIRAPVVPQISTVTEPAPIIRRSRKRKLQGQGPTLNYSDFQHYSIDNLSSRTAHQATSRIVNASDSAALVSGSLPMLPQPDVQDTLKGVASHYRPHTWTPPIPGEEADKTLPIAASPSLSALNSFPSSLPLNDDMASYEFPYRNMHPLPSYPSCSEFREYVPTPFMLDEVLDPTRAPLKYLTDLLEPFQNEDGGYAGLLDDEKRDSVLDTLLDEELETRDPFQAAMGLVMASKLGLKWDYV